MAQPDFISPPTLRVAAPKPKMTVYYALLILALLAMLTACLILYLEIRRFGGFGTVPQRISAIQPQKTFISHRGHRDHRGSFSSGSVNSVSSVANS